MNLVDIMLRTEHFELGDSINLEGAELLDFSHTLHTLVAQMNNEAPDPARIRALSAVRVTKASLPGHAYMEPEASQPGILCAGLRWEEID